MSWLGKIFKRNKELDWLFDLDLFESQTNRAYMKKLALEMCISFLAKTISQSEFRVRNGDEYEKNELYYRLNVRPNKNTTASTFWQKFVHKMVYDNEVLIIQADDGDLLIADDFVHNKYAVYDDNFKSVVVRGWEFKKTFKQKDVIHIILSNEKLSPLIDSLFYDYGELFGRILSGQKRKNQIRGTVKMDTATSKSREKVADLQEYIDSMYGAYGDRDIAIIPEQPGFDYDEKAGSGTSGHSVDEVNKVTDGFLEQVAAAIGIPLSLLKGDRAEMGDMAKNYMFFTISPLLKKIKDEADVKFFTKQEWMDGKEVEIKKPPYRDVFDLATAVDKLISSSVLNGNEIRSELGFEMTDNDIHDRYILTKNYIDSEEALEGG